jgi:hypothetical protein
MDNIELSSKIIGGMDLFAFRPPARHHLRFRRWQAGLSGNKKNISISAIFASLR